MSWDCCTVYHRKTWNYSAMFWIFKIFFICNLFKRCVCVCVVLFTSRYVWLLVCTGADTSCLTGYSVPHFYINKNCMNVYKVYCYKLNTQSVRTFISVKHPTLDISRYIFYEYTVKDESYICKRSGAKSYMIECLIRWPCFPYFPRYDP